MPAFDRDRMVADYNAERDRLVALVESLRPEDLALPTVCEGWTVKDLVAHMATSASNVQALMQRHYQPNPGVEVLNDRNAEGVAARRDKTVRQCLDELLDWHERNISYLRSLSDADLAVEGTLVNGKVIPRAQRFVNAGLHYREHGDMIRQSVANSGAGT
ncbi:MAG: maleylpyruvate isomerase N-terminal domain-containing protein [Chloroflexi bacterium]|nr:maleylpyruvate isomerase N-terminal domain-containing protein [Chloroflexota bacterium]